MCSLNVPLECGMWTNTLTDYRNLLQSINSVITKYSGDCVDGEIIVNSPATIVPRQPEKDTTTSVVERIQKSNTLKSQKDNNLKSLLKINDELNLELKRLNNEIDVRNSENLTISQATTKINTNLDCTVYEDKVKEIDSFNYKNFCTTQVYGTSRVNSLTKIDEYNKCVSDQKLINQKQKIIYNDLLENCVLFNNLQLQLSNAKFDNNTDLINITEKDIFVTQTKINTLTQEGSKFIESDSTQQKSQLEINNTQQTINETANLLNTSVESITDSDGNLLLTDQQKVTLNIKFTQNQSQISSLITKRGEVQVLLSENVFKINKVTNVNGTNLGSNLLSLGIGLIGGALFLKGYLDPETIGVMVSGMGVPLANIDKETNEGCVYPNGTQFVDGPYTYTIINSDLPFANKLCTSFSTDNWSACGGGGTGVYCKGCCQANRQLTPSGGNQSNNTGCLNKNANKIPC